MSCLCVWVWKIVFFGVYHYSIFNCVCVRVRVQKGFFFFSRVRVLISGKNLFALAVPLFRGGGSVELDAAPHSLCPFPHTRSPASPLSGCTRRLCLVLWLFSSAAYSERSHKNPNPCLTFPSPTLTFSQPRLGRVWWRFAAIDPVHRRKPTGMTSPTSWTLRLRTRFQH